MTGSDDGKRKRVSKACDICRSRKLKCDAGLPACSRCASGGLECKYTHTKKRPPKKQKKPAAPPPLTMTDLDQRMSRMEGLIKSLVGKIDPLAAGLETEDQYQDEDDDHDDSSSEDTYHDVEEPSLGEESDQAAAHGDTTKLGVHQKYYGSQSTFSVLSAKGLMWLGKRIGDPTLLPRFQSFHSKTAAIFLWINKRWTEPIERAGLAPFPDREMCKSLIDHFYDDFCFGNFILKKGELAELFDIYFRTAHGSTKGQRRLTNSDFLTMSVALAVGSQFMMDSGTDLPEDQLLLLTDICSKMTDNAVYYYSRVAVISEGLRTVQALMIYNFFTEFARGPPHNYILVSTMVRYAQEIGLHRRESLVGLSQSEALHRKKMWLLVYIFDRACCFMSGKPPIINVDDVSSVLSHEIESIIFSDLSPEVVAHLKDVNFNPIAAVEELESRSDDPNAYMKSPLLMLSPYYHSLFVEFTSKVYNKLFSAKALRGKNLSQVLLVIEELNTELESLKDRMNVFLRPGIDIKSIKTTRMRYDIATIHFQYHQLSMIINRMAFTRAWLNHDSADEFMNSGSTVSPLQYRLMIKCLEQARKIIHLVHDVGPHHLQLFSHYASFQFFTAFFTMFTGLLEFPRSPNFQSDIDLLFKVSTKLSDDMKNVTLPSTDLSIYDIICYSVRFFTRVAILAHNRENSANAIGTQSIDTEIIHYEKILNAMATECNRNLKHDDPLCVNPPMGDLFKTLNGSLEKVKSHSSRKLRSTSASTSPGVQNKNTPSHSYQQQPHDPLQPQAYPIIAQQDQIDPFPLNDHNGVETLFNSFPLEMNDSGVSTSAQTPDEKLLHMMSLEMFEGQHHSNILQQEFALPHFYLNANDNVPFDVDPNLMF